MKKKLLYLLSGMMGLLFITSCIKTEFEPQGDAGTTFIKFNDGPEKKIFFEPFTEIKKVNLFDLRRDAKSELALQTTHSIKLALAPSMITNYNNKNAESYVAMPESMFSFASNPGIVRANETFTFNFAPSNFAYDFDIMLDGSKWDLSKKYALAFKVTDAGGNKIVSGKDSIIILISIKNKYDGVYTVSGTMVDAANAALTHVNVGLAAGGDDPLEIELHTISATKCAVFDKTVVGNYAAPIWTGTAFSQYGSFSVVVEFDLATNKVIAVTNRSGQPAPNTRYGQLDASGLNMYDPGTKTVSIKYNMCQPSVITTAPFIRTTWDETWKFVKARQ